MKKHIILNAFGTTTQAKNTYVHLDERIRPSFPDCHIHWTYSSPTIRRSVNNKVSNHQGSLPELLRTLNQDMDNRIVVQSVHITPGHEFHRMVREIKTVSSTAAAGMPLLTVPKDYLRISDLLKPLLDLHHQDAILILGHGTTHPSWTSYLALEKILRQQSGKYIYLAALENYPESSSVIDDIAARQFSDVFLIPFLLVTGMHFQRDIIDDGPTSWKSRIEEKGMRLTLHNQGLGMLDGVAEIFCDHIRSAFDSLGL